MKEIKYIRPSGRFDANDRPEGLELCVGEKVIPLTDEEALSIARDIIVRLL